MGDIVIPTCVKDGEYIVMAKGTSVKLLHEPTHWVTLKRNTKVNTGGVFIEHDTETGKNCRFKLVRRENIIEESEEFDWVPNEVDLNDHRVLYLIIEDTLKNSNLFDKLIINTDSDEIANLAITDQFCAFGIHATTQPVFLIFFLISRNTFQGSFKCSSTSAIIQQSISLLFR
jgi:hypothetical protein